MKERMANSVQMNTRFVVGLLAIIGVTVYCLYSAWTSGSKAADKESVEKIAAGVSKNAQLRTFKTWKHREIANVPQSVISAIKGIEIKERHLEFTPKGGETVQLFFRETIPSQGIDSSKPQVLLLHGAAFSSKDWMDIKTLQLVAAMGYRVIALDLPGFGQSKSSKKPGDRAQFLASFIKQEKMGKPVLVSPSMSGSYAIPYLFQKGPSHCIDQVLGFIPVAPAAANEINKKDYAKCQVPTMIVYGTRDSMGESVSELLNNLPNSQIMPLKNAPHPAYMEKTDEWHKLLYNFLKQVESNRD